MHPVAGGGPDLTGVTRLSPGVSPRLRAARDADAWVAQQGVVSPGGRVTVTSCTGSPPPCARRAGGCAGVPPFLPTPLGWRPASIVLPAASSSSSPAPAASGAGAFLGSSGGGASSPSPTEPPGLGSAAQGASPPFHCGGESCPAAARGGGVVGLWDAAWPPVGYFWGGIPLNCSVVQLCPMAGTSHGVSAGLKKGAEAVWQESASFVGSPGMLR